MITAQQIQNFFDNGFLHLKGFFPAYEIKGAQEISAALIEKGLGSQKPKHYRYGSDQNGTDTLFRIDHLFEHTGKEHFEALLAYPPLLEAVDQVVDGDVFSPSVHSLVFKLPKRGLPVAWHQDPVTVRHQPVFNVDVYLDASHEQNGCLWVIPGSHKHPYREDREDFIDSVTGGAEGPNVSGAIPVITEPGDVVFHMTTLVHGSFWNTSNNIRRTLYFHFDHAADVTSKVNEGFHRECAGGAEQFAKGQEVLRQAQETRQAMYPEETPFLYRGAELAG